MKAPEVTFRCRCGIRLTGPVDVVVDWAADHGRTCRVVHNFDGRSTCPTCGFAGLTINNGPGCGS